jgi:hypothetical protein
VVLFVNRGPGSRGWLTFGTYAVRKVNRTPHPPRVLTKCTARAPFNAAVEVRRG